MRYGGFLTGEEAIQEHRLPLFFLIANNSLLNQIPNSYENLMHNTIRLNTKPDIRETMLFLANFQYGIGYKPKVNYNLLT
jgi:hypothetical protein